MLNDKILSEKLSELQALSKENKNIDVASLMIKALEDHRANQISPTQKRWAYLISLFAPPFGLLFALKFYFGDEDDAKHMAWICVGLTVLSIIATIIFLQVAFSSAGTSVQQIEQIKPSDINQLLQ